jgi:hypothetical protein
MDSWLDDGLYMYDTDTAVWEDVVTQVNPSARYAHTFVGVAEVRGFLFGGETLFGKSNELFELDITATPPRWIDHSKVNAASYIIPAIVSCVAVTVAVAGTRAWKLF